jgi:hypothetical protein
LNEAAEEPNLVMWYCYALLGPAIWAFLNHLDKYLLGRCFEADAEGPILALFTGFAGVIVAMTIPLPGAPVFTLAPWRAIAVMGAVGRERITRRDISRKAAAICVMCVGIVITFT